MQPICYVLYAGLHGWEEGFVAEGFRCVGFDILDCCEAFNQPRPPNCELRIRDVRSIHGSELKDATCIVGSSPCQEFSYRAMPWKRAKALPPPYLGIELFNAQFRIQREAIEAAGHYIPMVCENVRGAQKYVGRAPWHYGSFYLWGDVPALMPIVTRGAILKPQEYERRHGTGSWFAIDMKSARAGITNPKEIGREVPGSRFDGSGKSFQSVAVEQMGIKQAGISGPRENGKGDRWFQDGAAASGSKSSARKRASAMIAKIPLPLSLHIARTYYPRDENSCCNAMQAMQ